MNISEDTRRKFPNYVFLCDAYQLRSQEDIDQIVKKVNDGELLCAASIEGHLDIVKMLLNKPYNVNPNEEYEKELKKTPLLHACRNGHSVVAELLIDKGANVNSRDWDGYTPLRWAVSEGLSEVCLQLIYKGADLEGKKVSHDTRRILSIACRNGLYDVAKLMIEKGANVNTPDWGYADQRETPFYRACLHNHDKVALLLVQNGVTVNKTFKGQSPLLLACSYGFGDVALELIERNATIDFKFNYDGSTPFYRSCQKGLYDVVVTLINKGIHIDEVDGSGNSSFSAACANGHINIVKLLISKNIISDPIKQLLRPLKFACEGGHADVVSTLLDVEKTIVNYAKDFVFSAVKRGHIDVVKILIQNGISLNSIDMIGYTLLMHACVCDKADVAVFLIKSGAEVNTKGMNGASPLSLAADKGLTEVVELLIEKNVDINETSRMQKTALHLACESRGATGVLRVLIKAKASLDVIDSKGYTPLMRACYNGNNDAAVILLEAGANAKIGDNALSLLLFAANSRQELLNTVELLIKKGVDLEVKDSEGRTPLYSACEKNFSDVALLLIENGASVNVENENEGITLLLLVCRAGLTDVAKVLVTKGVELEDYDKYGRTALLMACHNGHSDEIATFLINHKADVHATDRVCYTQCAHTGTHSIQFCAYDHGCFCACRVQCTLSQNSTACVVIMS